MTSFPSITKIGMDYGSLTPMFPSSSAPLPSNQSACQWYRISWNDICRLLLPSACDSPSLIMVQQCCPSLMLPHPRIAHMFEQSVSVTHIKLKYNICRTILFIGDFYRWTIKSWRQQDIGWGSTTFVGPYCGPMRYSQVLTWDHPFYPTPWWSWLVLKKWHLTQDIDPHHRKPKSYR